MNQLLKCVILILICNLKKLVTLFERHLCKTTKLCHVNQDSLFLKWKIFTNLNILMKIALERLQILIYRSLFSDSGKLQLFVQVPRFNLDFVLSQPTYQHILKLPPEIQGVLQNMTFNT